MSIYSIQHSSTQGYVHNSATTYFHPLCGDAEPVTVEAEAEFIARTAWTLSDMFISVGSNTITASTAIRSRVAGANGNLSVTVPASTNGEFEDTTNTDSISSGNAVNWQLVIGSTGTSLGILTARALVEDASGDVAPYCVGTGGFGMQRSVTRYQPLNGESLFEPQPLEAEFKHQVAFTSSDLRVYVSSNAVSDPITCTAFPDGLVGNQIITIPADTAGAFVDTTNTDSVPADRFMQWEWIAGMGAHDDGQCIVETTESHSDSPTRASIAWGQQRGATAGAIEQSVIAGGLRILSQPETSIDVSLGLAYDADNFYTHINANSADASTVVVLRVNGADGNLTVTIGSSATGDFQDTTNADALLATDKVNMQWDATAVTSGQATTTLHGLELTETPVVAEGPEVIHFRSLMAFGRP